jgi:hypothetical protein
MRRLLIAAAALACAAVPAAAQFPVQPGQAGQAAKRDSAQLARDTIKVPSFRIPPPISPLGAMWRSMLLPGWGQAVMGRRVTGAAFVFWEGITLTMTVKAARQLSYWKTQEDPPGTETDIVKAKKQELQDWAVLLAFNHLLAGAEAFVSSEFWDFPAELDTQALPGGRTGLGLTLRFGSVP